MQKNTNQLSQETDALEFRAVPLGVFQSHYNHAPRANLLQSPLYGAVLARHNHQILNHSLITRSGQDIGLFQTLEAKIFGHGLHGIILDRGPLWLEGHNTPQNQMRFITALRAKYPKRFGRRMRFIPEMENNPQILAHLKAHGFHQVQTHSYQTYWIDLRQDIQILRKNLRKNWRGSLSLGLSKNIEISWNGGMGALLWLLSNHQIDRTTRHYAGVSKKLILSLAKEFGHKENILIGTAMMDNQPIAAILLLVHGASATYQIGYTSEKGREVCAHHVLLWDALRVLKERAINDFDLGGVNDDETARGIKSFKQGLGGQFVETAGLFN